jgi:hypothetical protein
MRLLSLAAALSLAISAPGCTIVGAAVGAAVAPHNPVALPAYLTAGGLIGLLIDTAIVVTVVGLEGGFRPPSGPGCYGCN